MLEKLKDYMVFHGCKTPKRFPDYVSIDVWRSRSWLSSEGCKYISSMYWYGKDKKGSFVIRCSNHWSYVRKERSYKKNLRKKIAHQYTWVLNQKTPQENTLLENLLTKLKEKGYDLIGEKSSFYSGKSYNLL